MMLRLSVLLLSLAVGGLTAIGPARAISDEERNKICTRAEMRYQKLFGKPSAEEDVTIVTMHKYTFCPSNSP